MAVQVDDLRAIFSEFVPSWVPEFRQVIDAIPAAIAYLDREGQIQYCNLSLERITGINRHELTTNPYHLCGGTWSSGLLTTCSEIECRRRARSLSNGRETVSYVPHADMGAWSGRMVVSRTPDLAPNGSLLGTYVVLTTLPAEECPTEPPERNRHLREIRGR